MAMFAPPLVCLHRHHHVATVHLVPPTRSLTFRFLLPFFVAPGLVTGKSVRVANRWRRGSCLLRPSTRFSCGWCTSGSPRPSSPCARSSSNVRTRVLSIPLTVLHDTCWRVRRPKLPPQRERHGINLAVLTVSVRWLFNERWVHRNLALRLCAARTAGPSRPSFPQRQPYHSIIARRAAHKMGKANLPERERV